MKDNRAMWQGAGGTGRATERITRNRCVSGQRQSQVATGQVDVEVRKRGPVGKTEGIWWVDGEWQETKTAWSK